MTAGDTNRTPADCQIFHAPKIIQTLPIMEQTSHMTTLSERESLGITEEIMARRLKNRERQRRYRARKRLEADKRKSYMIEQQALWSVEPQSCGINIRFEPCGTSAIVETQENNPTASCAARVHSGRKWKKDARLAHASKRLESPSVAKPPSVGDSNAERPTNSTGRRDWKADARNKMDVGARESGQ